MTTATPLCCLILGTLVLASVSCSGPALPADAPPTAASVDLARYTGRWYEIARLPAPFQKAGEAAIAEYGTNEDGTLSVRNIAVRPNGTRRDIEGHASVLNPPANTKLAVRFHNWFGPFIPVPEHGNYWIFHVDGRYEEAIVGTPDRRFLWILSRTPTISAHRKAALVAKARALGFDVARIITTQRPAR